MVVLLLRVVVLISTQVLVRHLNVWGFDCGIQESDLADAARIARALTNVLLS